MSGFVLRAATDADLPAIQAIYAHHVLHGLGTFEETPPDLAEIAARRKAVVEKGLPWLVADAGGEILGYAYAGPFRPRSAYRFAVEDSIYVAPSAARRGVGKALLAELLTRCAAWGARQMVAVIGDSGNAGSIGVHSALGFANMGKIAGVGFKHGRWVDVVIMQKALGDGMTTLPAQGR
ncbi:MAG: N-acetyltransferase [Azospirillum sp.]|jgi:L-amino acid N-acyltransferase YncA|nr:N-acetyltransferase [Azospirillum sp.]MCZ8122697.1 GNAT family N-acetyltransferase [Magnetospirillum sp.]